MKNVRIVLVGLLASLSSFAGDLRVQSSCYPCSVLPGTSAYFEIRVTNTGTEPLLVGNGSRLVVQAPGGEAREAVWHDMDRTRPEGPFMPRLVLLEPGESVSGVHGIDAPNGWAGDPVLSQPAVAALTFRVPYMRLDGEELALVLEDPVETRHLALKMVVLERRDDWVWASAEPMRYEILEPKGVDRQAWDFLKSFSKGPLTAHSWGSGLAAQLLAKYRWSGYTPEALYLVRGEDEPADLESYLEQAIRKYPDAGVTPRLAERLAATRRQRLFRSRDNAQAVARYKAAASAIELALENPGLPPYWRQRLEEERDTLLSEEAHDQERARSRGR